MKTKLLLLLFALLGSAGAQVANPSIVAVPNAPSGSCAGALPLREKTPDGTLYSCQNGTWAAIGGGAPTGSAGGVLSGTYPNPGLSSSATALPNGWTATTQSVGDNSTKVATTAYADRIASSTAPGSLASFGSVVNQTNWTSLANYSPNGTTPSVSGGTLVFTGGAGTYAQSLDYVSGSGTYSTTSSLWKESLSFTLGTVSSTSFGMGVGLRSNSVITGQLYGITAFIDTSTDANRGKLTIQGINGVTGTQLSISSGAVTIATGDSVILTMARSNQFVSASFVDITTATATNTTFTFGLTSVPPSLPNMGHFAIYNFGGTQTVTAFSVTELDPVSAPLAFVGDSKTVGYFQGVGLNGAFSFQYPGFATFAGNGDGIADVLVNEAEIIAHHPKAVILSAGRNDLCTNSVAIGTVETEYAQFITDLAAATPSIPVYNLLMWETSCATSNTFNAFILATYPTTTINPHLEFYGATAVLNGDHVHPNAFGGQLITSAITTYMQTASGLNQFVYYPPYLEPSPPLPF